MSINNLYRSEKGKREISVSFSERGKSFHLSLKSLNFKKKKITQKCIFHISNHDSMSKHDIRIATSLTNLPKATPVVSLLPRFQTSRLCGVVCLVQFPWSMSLFSSFTCVLHNGQMCIQLNMAEPTSVIFSP